HSGGTIVEPTVDGRLAQADPSVKPHRTNPHEDSARGQLFTAGVVIGVAEAANPTLLAETGGFLLGNAHRCGVAVERVERAGNVIHGFIVAAARDSSEAAAADSRFAEIFLASALAA